MAGLKTRTFDTPDETLVMGDKARGELVTAAGVRVWRAVVEPGWRYTEDTDGELCPAPHVVYVVEGRLGIEMADGTAAEAGPGDVAAIEPGHDAWTVGDQRCVFIDFGESVSLGQPERNLPT